MKILVTGAAGFIGGHLSEQFVSNGHSVTAIDNLDPYYDTNLKRHNLDQSRSSAKSGQGEFTLIRGDIRDRELVNKLIPEQEIVYHHAAQAGVRASTKNPAKSNDINVDGTLNILTAAREANLERLVIASSSSVYGKPKYLPYDEKHPTEPVSPYGVSKLAAEHYTRIFNELYGVPTVTLRYFTVYGPRMRPNMAISNFVSRCINGEPPVVYGEGAQTRDFTNIEDVVDVGTTLLHNDSADGEVLNIGSGDNISIEALAALVRDQLAPDISIEYDKRPEGDADHTQADITKASDLIGYNPTTTIREGVQEFIDWYRRNRGWYEPLIRKT